MSSYYTQGLQGIRQAVGRVLTPEEAAAINSAHIPAWNMAQVEANRLSREEMERQVRPYAIGFAIVASLSAGASAYHGYKRNNGSIGSAIGWGLLGGIFPIFVPAIALAQGFGKPKVRANRRKRRTSRRRRTSR